MNIIIILASQSSSTGIGFPDYTHPIPIGTTYTVLKNGWVYAKLDSDNGWGYKTSNVSINGSIAMEQSGADYAGHGSIIPVSTGDVIVASAHVNKIVFYPCIK